MSKNSYDGYNSDGLGREGLANASGNEELIYGSSYSSDGSSSSSDEPRSGSKKNPHYLPDNFESINWVNSSDNIQNGDFALFISAAQIEDVSENVKMYKVKGSHGSKYLDPVRSRSPSSSRSRSRSRSRSSRRRSRSSSPLRTTYKKRRARPRSRSRSSHSRGGRKTRRYKI